MTRAGAEGAAAEPWQPPDITTREGLQEWAFTPRPKKPASPTPGEYKRWSEKRRQAFDDARLNYIAQTVFRTPLHGRPLEEMMRRVALNTRLGPGPRPGAVIDSPGGGYGKSTCLQQLMRWWVRRCLPSSQPVFRPGGFEYVPAIYITLDAGTTVKSMMALFADFLYRPARTHNSPRTRNGTREEAELVELRSRALRRRLSRMEETALVQRFLFEHAVSLIVIDDIHFLQMHRQADRLVNEQLKKLASVVPATFICAGINCLNSGLLWEGLSDKDRHQSQTAGRFQHVEVERFRAHSSDWRKMLRTISRELTLLNAREDPLRGLDDYLYERSGGEIGTLIQLIREGVFEAIATGTEKLSEALLDTVTLSALAEAERSVRSTRNGKRPGTLRSAGDTRLRPQ